MGKKDQVKAIMSRLLGPASAAQVDSMSEEECVQKCKEQISSFLGESVAEKEFTGL
jgi:monoamine oxidase